MATFEELVKARIAEKRAESRTPSPQPPAPSPEPPSTRPPSPWPGSPITPEMRQAVLERVRAGVARENRWREARGDEWCRVEVNLRDVPGYRLYPTQEYCTVDLGE